MDEVGGLTQVGIMYYTEVDLKEKVRMDKMRELKKK